MNCTISTRNPCPTARNAVPSAQVVFLLPGPVYTIRSPFPSGMNPHLGQSDRSTVEDCKLPAVSNNRQGAPQLYRPSLFTNLSTITCTCSNATSVSAFFTGNCVSLNTIHNPGR